MIEIEKWIQDPVFTPGDTFIPAKAQSKNSSDLSLTIQSLLNAELCGGKFTSIFEKKFSDFVCSPSKAISLASGAAANLLALSTLTLPTAETVGISPLAKGDGVLTLPHLLPTLFHALQQFELVPTLIDVDRATGVPTLESIQSSLTPRTRVLVLPHLLGNIFRADILAFFCRDNRLLLIEDASQAFGGTMGIHCLPVGSLGDMGSYSFSVGQPLSMGTGGALIARHPKLRHLARGLREWGRDCWCDPGVDNTCGKRFEWCFDGLPDGYDHKYVFSSLGYNFKITEMQCALGVSQLGRIQNILAIRRRNWALLNEGFKTSKILMEVFTSVTPTPETNPSWVGYPLILREGGSRLHITSELSKRKIGSFPLFPAVNLSLYTSLGMEISIPRPIANLEYFQKNGFYLGIHEEIGLDQIQYMLEQLENIARSLLHKKEASPCEP